MESTEDQIAALERKLARLKGMKNPLWPKAHAYNVEQTETALKGLRLILANENDTSLKSFGESTGLTAWKRQQKQAADKAAQDAKALQDAARRIYEVQRKAAQAQSAALASLTTAQEQANAVVDPLWKNPFVFGAAALLGLAILTRR